MFGKRILGKREVQFSDKKKKITKIIMNTFVMSPMAVSFRPPILSFSTVKGINQFSGTERPQAEVHGGADSHARCFCVFECVRRIWPDPESTSHMIRPFEGCG